MKGLLKSIVLLSLWIIPLSCNSFQKNESSLSENDIAFIESLGILEKGEKIQHFACNSAFENIRQSGNFVSDRRIASYWIEKGQKEIHSAKYSEIATIELVDKSKAVSLSSYIRVKKSDAVIFDVYFDVDSLELQTIFAKANHNLENQK